MLNCYKQDDNGVIVEAISFNDPVPVYDENNEIVGYQDDANDYIKSNYLRTDKEIVQLVDGTFAFADEVNYEEEAEKLLAKQLEEIKKTKLTSLKNTRDTLEVEPIEYNGNNFDYDEKARDRINAAIIALDIQTQLTGTEASLSWTTADNKEAIVTANDLRGLIAMVALRSNELHIAYRKAKDKVNACTTKEELESIVLE